MNRFCFFLFVGSLHIGLSAAQTSPVSSRRTPQVGRTPVSNERPLLSVRAKELNERMTQEIGNAGWIRTIYREIDLSKDANAPLYYPIRPLNGSKNLFTIIFQLLSEGRIEAFKYEDGYEAFDETHRINFKEDVLDRAYIFYEEVPPKRPGDAPSFLINENDIPSADVLRYYIKEAWYFDRNNSLFDVKTLALCPILTTAGDFSDSRTTPLFWLPYENLRPYITDAFLMTSNLNNAKLYTMDDYFRRRMFQGDIIKTENLMNKTLQEYFPQEDSLALARDSIEKQLVSFGKSLWVQPDTTQVSPAGKGRKAARPSKEEKSARSKKEAKQTKEKKEKAAPAPKAEKSAAPARSVRRSRD
ncbi:MAG: gliding motility protein GldN [Tannerellaceae bacterium]|jgi:gliding motility associated protien GldN|nr:gliding motility protein GldN [Tannerellaceae bacterium]